jgi:hypothetical protein
VKTQSHTNTHTAIAQRQENEMKTKNEIEYEINFIQNELINKEFSYLTEGELKAWETTLLWTLKTGESE